MTVPYSYRVATSRGFGNFVKILTVWRGSVYQLLWKEFIAYIVTYAVISLFYRNYLKAYEPELAKRFGELVLHFRSNNSRIPMVFVLAFFVGIINERWWSQIALIPWPDSICLQLSVLLRGQDRRGRLLRRTIARYLNLSIMFAFRLLSKDVRKRFPTLESYCETGLLLPHELVILKSFSDKMNYPAYYVPVVWACNLVYRARAEGRISHDVLRRNLIARMEKFRGQLLELVNYDVVFVPLAYTQVATIAVYVYFVVALLGNQFVEEEKAEVDVYVPVFGFLEFIFFVGWFKAAESMLNPYGNDPDDFELNWIIDRNVQVAFLMVDERRRTGIYSHEVRPPRTEYGPGTLVKLVEVERAKPKEELFEEFTEEEKIFQRAFEDLLTKSPPTTPSQSVQLVHDASEEPESYREGRQERPRAGSIGEAVSRIAGSSHLLRSSSQASTHEEVTSRLRRPSTFGRLELELAAPGTLRLTPTDIRPLIQPDEIIPLVPTVREGTSQGQIVDPNASQSELQEGHEGGLAKEDNIDTPPNAKHDDTK